MTEQATRKVKGGRAAFFENAESDRLLAMMMRLVTDHWALKERVLMLEEVLVTHGVLTREQLESFQPDDDTNAAWDVESFELVQAIVEAGQNIDK